MKVILLFVTSADGKVTRWGDPDVKSWTSPEDKEHFSRLWQNARLVVMGSSTYEAETITPVAGRKVIVMTQRVDDYKNETVPGKLEFSDESPALVIENLTAEGYEEMLLVGGARVATSFFRENLIDEILLTIEPRIFGAGGNFVTERSLDAHLQLVELQKLNDQGTLILRYLVLKPAEKDA